MSDLICRKTMMRCQTPNMCYPHGGCQPAVQPHAGSLPLMAGKSTPWAGIKVIRSDHLPPRTIFASSDVYDLFMEQEPSHDNQ